MTTHNLQLTTYNKFILAITLLSLVMLSNLALPARAAILDDSACGRQGGTCQTSTCSGSSLSGLCAGAAERKCCVTGSAGGARGSGATGNQQSGSQVISLPNPLGSTKSIPDLIGKIVDWLILIASIAVLPFMFVWGAFQLLGAGGNPEKVIQGRHTITWAVVGYGLLILSKGIGLIIQDVLK